MPILSIEKRIIKPLGYHNFESLIPGESFYGEELANARMKSDIKIAQFGPGVSYRRKANVFFGNEEDAQNWFLAENEALGKVGQHREFVYRLHPDQNGFLEVYLFDSSLFQKLLPGMGGIILGEIAMSEVQIRK